MTRLSSQLLWRLLHYLLGATLFTCALLAAATASADADLTLANGLRLLVQEDHRTPDALVQIWYRVGSIDEPDGKTGLSHVVEHLMFTGTDEVPDDGFAKRIAAVGGRVNAFTGYHYTAYSEQLPASAVGLALHLEADRMRNLTISASHFNEVMKTVSAERKWRIDDSPQARVRERLMAVALSATPFAHPVIGWEQDIEQIEIEDARAWYMRWYAPDAAVVVIVGDVQSSDIIEQVKGLFEGIARKGISMRRLRAPESYRPQLVVVSGASIPAPYVAIAYPVPGLENAPASWMPYAFQVLAALLRDRPR